MNSKISTSIIILHAILIIFLVGIFTIWKVLIERFTSILCFTNKKVIGRVGLIKTKVLDAPLNKINNVSIEQGFFGKILGYGKIRIDTSSGTYYFSHMSDPNGFKAALMEQIDKFDEERIQKQAQAIAGSLIQQ